MIPPRPVRAVLTLDRSVGRAARVFHAAVAELMCIVVAPDERDTVTAWVYDTKEHFLPDGAIFDQGLFHWEQACLGSEPFPSTGRLLVGGVGGGREIVGLSKRGYHVVAFEPTALVEGAMRIGAACGADVVRASYHDLVLAARGRGGPLERVLGHRFDGVVLGWGSLSHVTSAAERRDLFEALRTLAPAAPVLCSFSTPPRRGPRSKVSRAFDPLRQVLGREPDWDLGFEPGIGFVHGFTRAEIELLAAAGGYAVVRYDERDYAHAVLEPLAQVGGNRSISAKADSETGSSPSTQA